jgi:hypothetical protein
MVYERRQKGLSLKQIAKEITDDCVQNYYCKDNVTLILVDLKKHYIDFQEQIQHENLLMIDAVDRVKKATSPQQLMYRPLMMAPNQKQHYSPQLHQPQAFM